VSEDLFTIQELRCGQCGGELPVMGRFVTFQCGTCYRRWILTGGGLSPLTVYRAAPPEEREGDIIYLPFWVLAADIEALRRNIYGAVEDLSEVSQKIATTRIERDSTEPDWITELGMNIMGSDPVDAKKPAMIDSSAMAKRLPSRAELEHLLSRMESAGRWHVYIPAFWTPNTRAYLKIGRMMTRRQPAFRAGRFDDPGNPVMCALDIEDASRLANYIFFSTLPESVQTCAAFMSRISLDISKPVLVEFPFLEGTSSLESLAGGFHIQPQLVGKAPAE
jgi:hypothetical protein